MINKEGRGDIVGNEYVYDIDFGGSFTNVWLCAKLLQLCPTSVTPRTSAARLFCPWDSLGKNIERVAMPLLQDLGEIFQVMNMFMILILMVLSQRYIHV